MAIWDDYLAPEDKVNSAVWGKRGGFGDRPALLIVDTMNAFVDPRYPLGLGEPGAACVRRISELRDAAREARIPVLYSKGKPAADPAELGRWKFEPKPRDPQLPEPTDIVPELEPARGEMVVSKRRPSAFFGTELTSLLIYHGIDTVILTGLVTSGCIRATAIDAFSQNFRVVVPQECVADRAKAPHAINLFDIHMKYGDVVETDEVFTYLDRSARDGRAADELIEARSPMA